MRFPDDALDTWRTHGFVVVQDVLTETERRDAASAVAMYFPTSEELAERPARYPIMRDYRQYLVDFPYAHDVLNNVATDPALLDFAAAALATPDVHLAQSSLIAKYGGGPDFEQELHLDYPNNSLVVPVDDAPFGQFALIVYYTDVSTEHGPTHVVSRTVTGGLVSEFPARLPRADYPAAYEHEVPVLTPAGGALLYGMTTYHRGSRFLAPQGHRFSHHLVYQSPVMAWGGWRDIPRRADNHDMKRFIAGATPRQREALGFPPVDSQYWTEQTIAGVQARYPGLDAAPYSAAVRAR